MELVYRAGKLCLHFHLQQARAEEAVVCCKRELFKYSYSLVGPV